MPVSPTYPGVYVQEVPSGVRTITGVSTSIAMFLGMTEKGQLEKPVRVLSYLDYERQYGSDICFGEMTDQVRQFFLNGGSQACVMRIADNALAAKVELKDQYDQSTTVMTLEARDAGAIGETIRITVDYDTSSPESTFNMKITREEADATGAVRTVDTEGFSELTMNSNARNYAVGVLEQQSKLLRATAATTPPEAIMGYSIAGVLMDTGGTGVDSLHNIIDSVSTEGKGRFQISVDGSAFVTVEITKPADSTQSELNTAIADPVNLALASFGKSVEVTIETIAGYNALKIASSKKGGSVRIVPAISLDIALLMQMGVAQGGLEVDGFATQRPAPTGFFSQVGPADGTLINLADLVGTDPGQINQFQVSGIGPNTAAIVNLGTWPSGNSDMSYGAKTGDQQHCFLNLNENLQYLVSQINASAITWKAGLQGFRVVLTPDFGNVNTGPGATVVTSGGADWASGNGIFTQAANVTKYRLGGSSTTPGIYQVGQQSGTNGAYPKLVNYTDAFPIINREVDLFNIMLLPRAKDQPDSDRLNLWSPASAFCQKRRAFLLVDPKESWRDRDAVVDPSAGIQSLRLTGIVKDHAAIHWPKIRIAAPEGGERTIDPSGSIAGIMARTDATRGVWKASAGVEATIRGVRGVHVPLSDDENGVINPEAVNAIRVFPNGIVNWGARTMDGFDNSGNTDYKYTSVRRTALFIEESLYRGLKWVVFEPNAEPLWGQIRLNVGVFMHNLFRQSAFKGQTPQDAYFVKCDKETTTQNDINLGIVNIWVGFSPLKPAEFVVIYLQQMAGQLEA